MGKPTGFIEYERKEGGYRPKAERLGDYQAVELQVPEDDLILQSARCMDAR